MNSPLRLVRPAAIALATIAIPLYAYKFTHKTDYTDFDVYYRAGSRFLAGEWDSLYSTADGASPFRYAPPLLLLFGPLALLPVVAAKLVWFALQTLGYAIGFLALGRTLTATGVSDAKRRVVVAASFLLILRLILDSWTIGQISGLMFAGFGLALQGFTQSRLGLASLGLFIPTLLKIGPGFSYIPLALEGLRLRRLRHVWLTPLFLLASMQAALWAVVPSGVFARLWIDWAAIVAGDSSYYDASHYGSQSLKSFLLRTFDIDAANSLWLIWSAALCLALGLLFVTRSTRDARSRTLLFSASFFPALLLMPEIFKYSMTTLAFPIGVALAYGYAKYSVAAVALFISVPGLDIVGKTLFFAIQRASLPFFSMSALAVSFLRRCSDLPMRDAFQELGPPEISRAPVRPGHALLLIRADGELTSDDRRGAGEIARVIGQRHASGEVRVCATQAEVIRELAGTEAESIYLCPIRQPCAPAFFAEAGALLASGAAWIRAQRRHSSTRFMVPVMHLPLAYRRHRMGVLLNSLLRMIFEGAAGTHDLLSLNGAMTRQMARLCAAHATTSGQLSLLEWQLTAVAHRLRVEEVACRFWLRTEKAAPRIWFEIASIARDLPRIWKNSLSKHYDPLPSDCLKLVTADDWGLSPGVNAGILELARSGALGRVSVMANEPYLRDGLAELLKLTEVETGLHFNVSHGKLLSGAQSRTPGEWLRARKSSESRDVATSELRRQLEQARAAGIPIRYLDGHHHIHLVPGWLARVAPTLREFGITTVRVPWDFRLLFTPKFPLALLAWLGGRQARALGFVSLPCRYPSSTEVADPRRLRRILRQAKGSEIITHPAAKADLHTISPPDPYNEARLLEWRSLGSLRP